MHINKQISKLDFFYRQNKIVTNMLSDIQLKESANTKKKLNKKREIAPKSKQI